MSAAAFFSPTTTLTGCRSTECTRSSTAGGIVAEKRQRCIVALLEEPELEQLVRLVQHQVLERRERLRALAQQRHPPQRRAQHHVVPAPHAAGRAAAARAAAARAAAVARGRTACSTPAAASAGQCNCAVYCDEYRYVIAAAGRACCAYETSTAAEEEGGAFRADAPIALVQASRYEGDPCPLRASDCH